MPEKLVIPSSQLHLLNNPIGQGTIYTCSSLSEITAIILHTAGEFGIVYKAQLVNWRGRRLPLAVAVKTVKGTTTSG